MRLWCATSSSRSKSRNDMDRGGSLFGSQTSSSSVIESSLEIRFGSSDLFSIIQVGGSNLGSLYVTVDRTKSNVFPSLGGSEGSIECSLGLSNLRSVLNGSSGSHGQEGTDEQFVHLDEFPENLQSELPM